MRGFSIRRWTRAQDQAAPPIGSQSREGQPPGGIVGGPTSSDTAAAARDSAALLRPTVYGLSALLLVIALANLLAAALLAVRERVHDMGVLRAIGLTPGETTLGVVSGQAFIGVISGLVGVPLGVAAFQLVYLAANGSTAGAATAPLWQLALVIPAAAFAAAISALVPARWAANVEVTTALRYE